MYLFDTFLHLYSIMKLIFLFVKFRNSCHFCHFLMNLRSVSQKHKVYEIGGLIVCSLFLRTDSGRIFSVGLSSSIHRTSLLSAWSDIILILKICGQVYNILSDFPIFMVAERTIGLSRCLYKIFWKERFFRHISSYFLIQSMWKSVTIFLYFYIDQFFISFGANWARARTS